MSEYGPSNRLAEPGKNGVAGQTGFTPYYYTSGHLTGFMMKSCLLLQRRATSERVSAFSPSDRPRKLLEFGQQRRRYPGRDHPGMTGDSIRECRLELSRTHPSFQMAGGLRSKAKSHYVLHCRAFGTEEQAGSSAQQAGARWKTVSKPPSNSLPLRTGGSIFAFMVSRSPRSDTPDLFSKQSDREHSSPSSRPEKDRPSKDPAIAAPPVPRYVLPQDLPGAMKQLTDQELERLVEVSLAEQDRRFGKPSVRHAPSPNKRRHPPPPVSLTPSKVNAVRAAFKAGVKTSEIARQFGLSKADVQGVLARK
jgi:hypothetical protein